MEYNRGKRAKFPEANGRTCKLPNLLLGRPLETSAEHEHHIGVAAGIPIFGLDGLTSAAYGPEQAMSLLIPLGLMGMQQHLLPIFTAILMLLVDSVLQLPADDRGVSERRRLVHGCEREPGRHGGAVCGGGADDRLHPDGGGGHLRRRDGAGECGAAAASASACAVPADPGHHRAGEHARREGVGLGVHAADVPVCGDAAGDGCGGRVCTRWRRAGTRSPVSCSAAGAAGDDAVPDDVAADEGVCQRMRGDDRRGSGFERRDGVQGAASSECEPGADGDYRHPDCAAVRAVVCGEGVRRVGDGPERERLSERAVDRGGGGVRAGLVLLRDDGQRAGGAGVQREHGVCGLSADGAGDCAAGLHATRVPGAGPRLLFSHGIYALTGLTAMLLIIFDGVTDRLIPLYAIGAFLAFTLSQAGHGAALDEGEGRAASRHQDVSERAGRGGDGHHAGGGAGGEVYVGRVGYGDAGAAADCDDAGDQAALRTGGGGDCGADAAAHRRAGAADRGDSDGAVGQD